MAAPEPVALVHITTVPMSLRFLAGQPGYMRERGLATHVITSPGDLLDRFAEVEGVTPHAVEMPRRITPLRDLVAVCRLWRCLRQIRPQIVHAHTPKGGLLGMIAARLAGAPVRIYHMRGLPFMSQTGFRRALLRWTERVACALAHQVISNSQSNLEIAVQEGLCPAHKIKVLLHGGNGVDATHTFNPDLAGDARESIRARYNIPPEAPVIGYVGRIVRDKGIVELAGAWEQLRAEYPAAHLLMVGPFEQQDPVPARVESLLRTDERIHLTGMIDDKADMPAFYAAMDMLALPSYREGLPNAPLEAAAMELPVVSTTAPGCVDAVADGVTGTLVPVRDAEALAGALRRYLDDAALRRAHGAAGRARALRDFRPEDVWAAIYAEYRRLLAEARLPRSVNGEGAGG